MAYIYLHKLFVPEKNRVDPDDIRMIEPMEDSIGVSGSIVTFNNNESVKYKETPQEIERMEWRMRHLWPNVERTVTLIIGGIIGGALAWLFHHSK
jgi:hypothetical protein